MASNALSSAKIFKFEDGAAKDLLIVINFEILGTLISETSMFLLYYLEFQLFDGTFDEFANKKQRRVTYFPRNLQLQQDTRLLLSNNIH